MIRARQINQTWKMHKLERKCSQSGDNYIIFFFFKITDDGYSFRVQWYGGKNEIICGHVETSKNDDKCAKCHGSCNEGEEWLCCPACHQWYHEDCFL